MRGAAGGAAVDGLVAERAGEARAAVASGSVGRVVARAAVEARPRRAVARRRHGRRHRYVAARAAPAALALAAESHRLPNPSRYQRDPRRTRAIRSAKPNLGRKFVSSLFLWEGSTPVVVPFNFSTKHNAKGV